MPPDQGLGQVNIEDTLNDTPQFRGSQGDGKFNNGQASAPRPWTCAPGRPAQPGAGQWPALHHSGSDQTTDVNTIPIALIERTEIVTGGSSAVYGPTPSPAWSISSCARISKAWKPRAMSISTASQDATWSVDLTGGANFAHDRGNIAVSIGYLNRGAISRQDRGGIYIPPYGDGCVTAATASSRQIGTQITGLSGQACLNAGGAPGLVFAGSGDIPNGRYTPTILPGSSNAAVNAAYAAAGLSGTGSFGYTFNDAGTTPRPAIDPTDRYNLTLPNYLQVPQERWMINSFMHYDLFPRVTAYAEMHFSTNSVTSRLSPSNVNATMLFNDNNPISARRCRACWSRWITPNLRPA